MLKNNTNQEDEAKSTKQKGNAFSTFVTRDLGAWMLLVPMLICVFYFTLRPQILSIYWSFHKMVMYEPKEFVGLKNYITVLSRPDFFQTVRNTFTYVLYWFILKINKLLGV